MSTTNNAEYDLIFAGGSCASLCSIRSLLTRCALCAGGTTSCLVAGRLADADPTLRILIVEAGPHTKDDLAHTQPARYLSHLRPDSTTVTFVVANPEKELRDRQTIVPTGHCVGGGSSVNCESRLGSPVRVARARG